MAAENATPGLTISPTSEHERGDLGMNDHGRLRHRKRGDGASPTDPYGLGERRRSSGLSDQSVDERGDSSASVVVDGSLLSRPAESRLADHLETSSNWHSAPLAFALLPAVAGLIFHNGGAVVTDVTLLALAGVFLNWSVRMPW